MGLTAGPYPFERGFFKQFIDVQVGRLLPVLRQLAGQQEFNRTDALDGPERFLLAGQSETQWM